MKRFALRFQIVIMGAALLAAGGLAARWIWPEEVAAQGFNIPQFSELATRGNVAYDAICAKCHGINGIGTQKGPPLVFDIYNPGHHADEAFFRAAKNGVPQHHWRFGNMPPLPNVTKEELTSIVRYIREMQEANGIVYRRHVM